MGPLHFEDLNPHRFEDLVRALLYDFRSWQKLEGTGRGGGADGFDVRGWEAPQQTSPNNSESDDADEAADFLANARLWLIQCKREKAIGPAKLKEYLDDISQVQRKELDAILFVAACDFSKKTRDTFRDWCVEAGIAEYHIWGKADIEDLLLQPKNDSLLFAFFGISLIVRKRSLRTEIRARLATKKKITKIVGHAGRHVHKLCLFRDPTDENYPDAPEKESIKSTFAGLSHNWFVRAINEVRHDGVVVSFGEHMAYLAEDGEHWDFIKRLGDRAIPNYHENPWEHSEDRAAERKSTQNARAFWGALPPETRANMSVAGFISYDDILAIDEDGDEVVDIPTIFVSFDQSSGPFRWVWALIESTSGERSTPPSNKSRIEFFPKEFPEAPQQQPFYVPDGEGQS